MTNDGIFLEIVIEQQQEYLKRLDTMNKRNNITLRIVFTLLAILIGMWTYNYFHTPYLTRNYNNVNNNGYIDSYKGGE